MLIRLLGISLADCARSMGALLDEAQGIRIIVDSLLVDFDMSAVTVVVHEFSEAKDRISELWSLEKRRGLMLVGIVLDCGKALGEILVTNLSSQTSGLPVT